ncbi:hypothetical protein B566_EDAN001676 [Ephemera danica]|nr:hypothetical protein B566_EDAN001676 [Ephemera danica]
MFYVDPTNQGSISAPVAAKFLKKSGLSDIILSKGELPNVAPMKPPQPVGGHLNTDWTVQPTEKAKYDKLFDSLEPVNGLLPGNKVKGVLLNSKLPMTTLGKVWDLADMDKDGMLDRHEFTVALEKHTIPASLPPELMRPKPPGIPPAPMTMQAAQPLISNKPPAIPPMPQMVPIIPQHPLAPSPIPGAMAPVVAPPPKTYTSANTVHWVVSPEECKRCEARFALADKDRDGFVSGAEIKDIFLQSGLPQQILAHIWALCDAQQTGKLNLEQFALAMWLIDQTLGGNKPPAVLAPDMIPPCMRPKPADPAVVATQSESAASNSPYPSNPELDMISREIDELAREKRTLETDIAQKEADIKIKSGEIKSLQSELDTLAATLKQLENQKVEANKRLSDLKGQKSTLDKEVSDTKLLLEEEQSKVALLRSQADEQERGLKEQEAELSTRRQELENLKQEEQRLETTLKQSRSQFDGLTNNLQDTQLLISQAKAKITQLEEQHRQMDDTITLYDSALTSNDASSISESSLAPASTEFRDPEFVRFAMVNGGSPPAEKDAAFQDDPFSGKNGPADRGGFDGDAFANDQFKSSKVNSVGDPFNDPFASSFPATQTTGFSSDPFASFGNSGGFDPFGENQRGGTSKTPVDMTGKDPFGCDPFAAPSPAPTPSPGPPLPPLPDCAAGARGQGADSPTPALPPKKSKQPPPRPAPPKNMLRAAPQPPIPPSPSPEPTAVNAADPFSDPFSNSTSDPFSGGGGGGGGFANFADFDSKFSNANHSSQQQQQRHSSSNNNKSSSSPNMMNNNHYSSSASSSANPSPALAPPAPARTTSKGRYATLEFTEDPFRDYRYEDPFEIEDPFENVPLPETPTSASNKQPLPSAADEDSQVAWAAEESVREEQERQRRLQRQEQEDLEYALALSRSETTAGGK